MPSVIAGIVDFPMKQFPNQGGDCPAFGGISLEEHQDFALRSTSSGFALLAPLRGVAFGAIFEIFDNDMRRGDCLVFRGKLSGRIGGDVLDVS